MSIVPTTTFTSAKASTCVMPKYHPTGQRDAFVALDRASFSSAKRGGRVSLKKIANAKPPTLQKFVPSGNGRDMFQQLCHDPIMTHAGVTRFSEQPPRRNSIPHGVAKLHVPVPRYIPTGTGRDVMNVHGFKGTYTAVYTSSFKLGRRTANPRARTDPPPRYQASGSGRDTFHNCDEKLLPLSPSKGLLYGSDQLVAGRPKTIQEKLLLSKEFCAHQTHSVQRLASPTRLPSPEMKQLRLSTAPSQVPRPAPMFIKL